MNLFITGTDTGVGKTYVASLLVNAMRQHGVNAIGMKPICCGDRDDAEALRRAGNGTAALNDINPIWFRTPAAPYAATIVENRSMDLELIREAFARLSAAYEAVVVEGAGGWLVPITREFSMADLAVEFGLPVIVVAANRLGAINHTLLTINAVRAMGMQCAGIVVNQPIAAQDPLATATNRSVLEHLLPGIEILEIAHDSGTIAFPPAWITRR